ncbi:hypothetical protein [Herbiconiux sp. VKM Ac-2851]|uniref:hypothetical protein n=1 Tax=Herbiconiux sp. VKM Ac-2851 TaxID=2739025 RepID=UPI001564015E|nr:hypothetical protein [Herbiconiux sp. VKM Ac-2851]NQX34723.1 hypothetical protein [Herbiconiux sp. VKM Ac-2851]
MDINIADLTPRELQLYAAGYCEGIADKNTELALADTYLEQDARLIAQLRNDLERANADADRYYRAAYNPRPAQKSGVPLAVLEQQRDELYAQNQATTFRPWEDTPTRRPAAA